MQSNGNAREQRGGVLGAAPNTPRVPEGALLHKRPGETADHGHKAHVQDGHSHPVRNNRTESTQMSILRRLDKV